MELVGARARTRPHAVALRTGAGDLTYAELVDAAESLAGRLHAAGVGRQDAVALRLDRGAELVVAALAVLRLGAAYVPIDPAYPPERQRWMLDDCAARAMLTPDLVVGSTVDPPPWLDVHPAEIAYVIYTSGSTGRPKGVEVTYGGLANLVAWHRRAFAVTAADRATLLAGVGFDASVWELWPYLTAGATVVVPDESARRSPVRLRDLLLAERVTIAFVPTALAEALLDLPWPPDTALRTLLTGGDRLHRRPPPGLPFTLVNNYGPTENTVVATSGPVVAGAGKPSLGTTIDGVRGYVLDPAGRPAATGELYLGGAGVARGYRGRPALTAERFLPDPSGPPGSRRYRTGDLVQVTADGTLEFRGRADDQVQVRGHRVEPGEVEALLAGHPAVRSAAVVAGTDGTGATALTGHVVLRDGHPATVAQLREYLRERLPEALVPAWLVIAEALPLTPYGKVDRAALAAVVVAPAADVAACSPTEAAVIAIWREVLGRSGIGPDNRFDDVGGHSLAAVRVAGRIARDLGVDVPLESLFGPVTPADVAAAVDRAAPSARAAPASPPVSGPRPLSSAQRRLWFFDRLVPGSSLYNVPLSFTVHGGLDPVALERALNEIVRRHEPLRTRYGEHDGEPVQYVEPSRTVPLVAVDLRRSPQRRAALVRAHAQEPFDLGTGPVLRALLLQLADDHHELVLTVHHIAFDGWSVGVLLSELGALYAASGGLAPLAPRYADLVDRQPPEVLDRQLAHWRAQLFPAPQPLELPADRPRPATRSYRGAKLRRPLPAALVVALEALGRRTGSSLFMVMFAAYQVLLHRYTGQVDIVTGVPVAGRDHRTEALIGFFTNTLALRVDLSGDPTFTDLLGRVRRTVLDGSAHADVPLERVVADLNPDRDAGHNPLFQVLFVMLNLPMPAVEAAGTRIRFAEELDNGCAKLDLLLFVDTAPDRPAVLTAEYASDLFDPETVDRFLAHYVALLESASADPGCPISRLPMPRDPAVVGGPRTAPYPDRACLHTLVEEQVARTPDAVAVEFEGATLTYAGLDCRANQLAQRLRRAGVTADVPVALHVERSLDLVVAVLAILKAGGAYVPLDPSYPPARLAQILADVAAPVLVAHSHLRDRVPATVAHTICVDDPGEGEAASALSPVAADPDSLAYVLFTSGSTGRPKGVAMPHRAIVNLLAWQRTAGGLVGPARTLQFAAIGFDVSCQEIFTTLTDGGTLVMVRDEVRRDMAALVRLIESSGVERVFLPFVALQHLAEAAATPRIMPSRLRDIVTAGEQLQITPQIARLAAALPGVALHNHYGPTETHVATAHVLTGDPADWPVLPPIGRSIANVTVDILDGNTQPVPVGVPGELYLGGVCLARGYHARPGLTADRFVPASHCGGGRMYRTGDLARFRHDGTIEFLGRADDQVKIRGYRVELGEVEAALSTDPDVCDVAVVARASPSGSHRLVAYIVPRAPFRDDRFGARCRARLASLLPDYLVPAAFVVLDALPLTPSGKVDRRALPEPPTAAISAGAFAEPETSLESVVALVWADVLGAPRVGRHDDFFHLGGHSLVATRMTAQLREALDVDVPLKLLFANPTVAGFAAALRAGLGDDLEEAAELFLMVAARSDEDAQALLDSLRTTEDTPQI